MPASSTAKRGRAKSDDARGAGAGRRSSKRLRLIDLSQNPTDSSSSSDGDEDADPDYGGPAIGSSVRKGSTAKAAQTAKGREAKPTPTPAPAPAPATEMRRSRNSTAAARFSTPAPTTQPEPLGKSALPPRVASTPRRPAAPPSAPPGSAARPTMTMSTPRKTATPRLLPATKTTPPSSSSMAQRQLEDKTPGRVTRSGRRSLPLLPQTPRPKVGKASQSKSDLAAGPTTSDASSKSVPKETALKETEPTDTVPKETEPKETTLSAHTRLAMPSAQSTTTTKKTTSKTTPRVSHFPPLFSDSTTKQTGQDLETTPAVPQVDPSPPPASIPTPDRSPDTETATPQPDLPTDQGRESKTTTRKGNKPTALRGNKPTTLSAAPTPDPISDSSAVARPDSPSTTLPGLPSRPAPDSSEAATPHHYLPTPCPDFTATSPQPSPPARQGSETNPVTPQPSSALVIFGPPTERSSDAMLAAPQLTPSLNYSATEQNPEAGTPPGLPKLQDNPHININSESQDMDTEAGPNRSAGANIQIKGRVEMESGREAEHILSYPVGLTDLAQHKDQGWGSRMVFTDPFVITGVLELLPNARKPMKKALIAQHTFALLSGRVAVQVHMTRFFVDAGGIFIVPERNYYEIENCGQEIARLFFTRARSSSAELPDRSSSSIPDTSPSHDWTGSNSPAPGSVIANCPLPVRPIENRHVNPDPRGENLPPAKRDAAVSTPGRQIGSDASPAKSPLGPVPPQTTSAFFAVAVPSGKDDSVRAGATKPPSLEAQTQVKLPARGRETVDGQTTGPKVQPDEPIPPIPQHLQQLSVNLETGTELQQRPGPAKGTKLADKKKKKKGGKR